MTSGLEEFISSSAGRITSVKVFYFHRPILTSIASSSRKKHPYFHFFVHFSLLGQQEKSYSADDMDEEFVRAVEDGFKLSKRLRRTKDRFSSAPPKPPPGMDRSERGASSLLPTSPMVYAVISDPSIVDNPDVPSYQPHVYGEMDPPALIPLPMNGIAMEIVSYMDSARVTVKGSWRVHCVMGSKSCDCRLMVPMGEQV